MITFKNLSIIVTIILIIQKQKCEANEIENENAMHPTTQNKFPAAVDSYHQIRYIEVPSQRHGPKEPQIHTLTTHSLPMKLLFRTTSSHLHVDQQDDHIPDPVTHTMPQNKDYRYSSSSQIQSTRLASPQFTPSLSPPQQTTASPPQLAMPLQDPMISPIIPARMMAFIPITGALPSPSPTPQTPTDQSIAYQQSPLTEPQLIPIYPTTKQFFNAPLTQQPITYAAATATQFLWPLNFYPMVPVNNYNNNRPRHHHHPLPRFHLKNRIFPSPPPPPPPVKQLTGFYYPINNNHRMNGGGVNNILWHPFG